MPMFIALPVALLAFMMVVPERAGGVVMQWKGAWFRRVGDRVFVTVPPAGVLEFR